MPPTIPPQPHLEEQFKAFGDFEPALGPGFRTTQDNVADYLAGQSRGDVPMENIAPWECRIGGSRFFVPPINIEVSTPFKVGSLVNGAIRQQHSPKFNAGQSQTRVAITLYFPSDESIWGFAGNQLTIDFNKDPEPVVDRFMGSLRGLVAQFRYAPIVPIKNAFLNGTFGITGVVMQSMTVSTLENFPFCLVVQLNMLKFNHEIFLPMIGDFNDAIHWGRFRQYIGRAAQKLQEISDKNFLTIDTDVTRQEYENRATSSAAARFEGLEKTRGREELSSLDTGIASFNKGWDWYSGSNIELYYPDHDPARQVLPDLSSFRDPDLDALPRGSSDWWSTLTRFIGIDIDNNPVASYDRVINYPNAPQLANEYRLLVEWLKTKRVLVNEMGPGKMNDWIDYYVDKHGRDGDTQGNSHLKMRATEAWMGKLYESFLAEPWIANVLAFQEYLRGHLTIQEWEVPMRKLGLNNPNVIVNAVNVSMANNIAPMQLQMQAEPAYQHIGGLDTSVEISLTVFGEDDLTRLRRMYEGINGLARLEHSHAVLGFLGIKNVITALCGMKYCLPTSFDVQTVPNYPHTYNVRLSFTDFDVFQQKREMLSSAQQKEFVEAFSKKNPFLRIKQLWGAFNAYPDFPLSIRNEEGDIIGHLDPDFYFRSFQVIDDDIVDWRAKEIERRTQDRTNTLRDPAISRLPVGMKDEVRREATESINEVKRDASYYQVVHHFSDISDDSKPQSIGLHADGFDFRSGNDAVATNCRINEPHVGNTQMTPWVEGCSPASNHMQPYADASGNMDAQSDLMLYDMQYRDKSGRMLRAYPTYMLWLIDENGKFAGVKMFDNFYGLQSVLDFSIVRSEDILGDTLVLRLSNLYSRLSTKYRGEVDESIFGSVAQLINQDINRQRNLLSGFTNALVELDTIELKPGVRVHMRVGYSANPNLLETVFNGVITTVEQGDVITVTCQSDAIELSAIVNGKNPNADTGKLDGSLMSGFWLSEPRDLMCRLLSMGGSTFRETVAHATHGMIYSENRFGIRHFGNILYEPLTPLEKSLTDARAHKLSIGASGLFGFFGGGVIGGIAGFLRAGMGNIMTSMWINVHRRRDYEIYKRNIYPGNGLGVAQYMGGDLGDGGMATAFMPPGIEEGSPGDPATGAQPIPDPAAILDAAQNAQDHDSPSAASQVWGLVSPIASIGSTYTPGAWILRHAPLGGFENRISQFGRVHGLPGFAPMISNQTKDPHPFLRMLGIYNPGGDDDDLRRFDEVSFRAQTYMKSVWDIFLICAALLPNYVVAVRPFEDRSTVFYGKPHWMYTSGVIPLTKGIDPGHEPKTIDPDDELNTLLEKAEAEDAKKETTDDFYERLSKLSNWDGIASGTQGGDPMTTGAGMAWKGGDMTSLPTTHVSGAVIPAAVGRLGIEMHLPTDPDFDKDKAQHVHMAHVPDQFQHPFYMDRIGGGVGGVSGNNKFSPTGTIKAGDNPSTPGKSGAFGYLDPQTEAWYMNMRWPSGARGSNYKNYRGRRILIYSPDTKKAVICAPGEYGPSAGTGKVAGCSPEVWFALDQPKGNCHFGFVDDKTALGPVDMSTADKVNASGAPSTSSVPQGTFERGGPALSNPAAGATAPSAVYRPDWMKKMEKEHPDHYTSTKGDPVLYAETWGWHDVGVPVDFSKDTLVDVKGQGAHEVYKDSASDDEANDIWDEFRKSFAGQSENINTFHSLYPNLGDDVYHKLMDAFEKFMWSNAYHRGWLVNTADVQFDALDAASSVLNPLGPGGVATEGAEAAGGFIADAASNIPIVGGVISGGFNLAESTVGSLSDTFRNLNPFSGGGGKDWNFHQAHALFRIYISGGPGGGEDAARQWMMDNNHAGKRQTGILGRAVEEFNQKIWSKFAGFISHIVKAVGSTLLGVVSLMRMSLAQLMNGLNLASYTGQQANMLNRMFNDSIYYQGPMGSLMYYADNPFTREYGEPVVEIRQPFQRMHHINSFQHILNNGIIQNFDGVATVVTATSNGKHPVTVHFDKSAPTEKQVEKTVETGLFWDHPTGFSRIVHPIQQLRSWASHFNNGDNETSAKRVALWNLKEGLKDIYSGEIVLIGDPSIRPHDLLYIGDVYEKIYGMVEVEQVVHHFTSDTGFITSITPNAMVTINDPARWQFGSLMQRRHAVHALRNELRLQLGVRAGNDRLYGTPDSMGVKDIESRVETALKGSTQYSGGAYGIVKDIGGLLGIGGWLADNPAGLGLGLLPPIGPLGPIFGWKAFTWVRDNVLDAHGCYIQYLNHNGRPMDAGLSYNHGVAVGQVHTMRLFGDALRLTFPISIDGQSRISSNDLLQQLGWSEQQIETLETRDVDFWVNNINRQVINLTGRSQEGTPNRPPEVYYVGVDKVEDADTIYISPPILGKNVVRMQFINAPELFAHGELGEILNKAEPSHQAGQRAKEYVENQLITKAKVQGYSPTVAIRINPEHPIDNEEFGRLLGVIFYDAPENLEIGDAGSYDKAREDYLMSLAKRWPLVEWDSYGPDGRAYTLNWELVLTGHANIFIKNFNESIPGEGVVGGAQ